MREMMGYYVTVNNLIPCKLEGSGKYLLLSSIVDGTEVFFLRGGSQYVMHRDIVAELRHGGLIVAVYGGGGIEINEGGLQIVVSGSSQKYGEVLYPEKVKEILKQSYPEWSVTLL